GSWLLSGAVVRRGLPGAARGAAGGRRDRRAARILHAALHLSAAADLPAAAHIRASADPGRKYPRALWADGQGRGSAATAAGRGRSRRRALSALSALPGRARLYGRRGGLAVLA